MLDFDKFNDGGMFRDCRSREWVGFTFGLRKVILRPCFLRLMFSYACETADKSAHRHSRQGQ